MHLPKRGDSRFRAPEKLHCISPKLRAQMQHARCCFGVQERDCLPKNDGRISKFNSTGTEGKGRWQCSCWLRVGSSPMGRAVDLVALEIPTYPGMVIDGRLCGAHIRLDLWWLEPCCVYKGEPHISLHVVFPCQMQRLALEVLAQLVPNYGVFVLHSIQNWLMESIYQAAWETKFPAQKGKDMEQLVLKTGQISAWRRREQQRY